MDQVCTTTNISAKTSAPPESDLFSIQPNTFKVPPEEAHLFCLTRLTGHLSKLAHASYNSFHFLQIRQFSFSADFCIPTKSTDDIVVVQSLCLEIKTVSFVASVCYAGKSFAVNLSMTATEVHIAGRVVHLPHFILGLNQLDVA